MYLALADLLVSPRHPAGAGDWSEEEEDTDDRDNCNNDFLESLSSRMTMIRMVMMSVEKDNLPVALAHLGPDIGAESPQGSRHPDHSSKDEETKLSHLLFSGQDKGFSRPLTAEVGH